MSVIEGTPTPTGQLRDFYNPDDYSDIEVREVLQGIEDRVIVEQKWFKEAGLKTFATDMQISRAVEESRLVQVDHMPGLYLIPSLRNQYQGYSPPYLVPQASHVLETVGSVWFGSQARDEDEATWALSLTSMVRSTAYQISLASKNPRQPTIDPQKGKHSSHEYGFAFDIDQCGLYRIKDGQTQAINPNIPHNEHIKVSESRQVLTAILAELVAMEVVNFVDEMPETTRWVAHICVNPLIGTQGIKGAMRKLRAA